MLSENNFMFRVGYSNVLCIHKELERGATLQAGHYRKARKFTNGNLGRTTRQHKVPLRLHIFALVFYCHDAPRTVYYCVFPIHENWLTEQYGAFERKRYNEFEAVWNVHLHRSSQLLAIPRLCLCTDLSSGVASSSAFSAFASFSSFYKSAYLLKFGKNGFYH